MSSRAARAAEEERRAAEAGFAQERRDTEKNARDHLKSTIPDQYQQNVGSHGLKMNEQGKAMEAAGSYITDLKAQIDGLKAAAATVSPPRARAPIVSFLSGSELPFADGIQIQTQGGAVTTGITPTWVTQIDNVAGIRQVSTRLRQKVEEKVQAEGQLSGELKEVIDRAHDLLVDMTDAVEQGNLSPGQKRKWADVQKELGRGGFYTQQ